MTTTVSSDTAAIFRDNLSRIASFAATVRERQEQAQREAEAQAAREAAEQAARTIRQAVDPTVTEQAKEHGLPLISLLRRFQDAQAKFESVRREVDSWTVAQIESDDGLDRTIAIRNQLEASGDVLTFDGRRKLATKIAELNTLISDAKSRFFAKAEPLFKTHVLFSGFNPNRVRPTGRNRRQFVLPLSTLEANDPQAAERIAALFNSCGVELFPGEYGPSIVLEPKQILVGNGPYRSEFCAPTDTTIDGLEIVKDTRNATEWFAEQEAERHRKETERQEAERETARRERERKLAEFREMMAEAQQQPITDNS